MHSLQVYPPPVETLDMERVLDMVSSDGNLLQQYFDSDRNPKAFGLTITIGSVLNHIAQKKTNNNETDSDGKISSEQVRQITYNLGQKLWND